MSDTFDGYVRTMTGPGEEHMLLTADAANDVSPRPRSIWCNAAGTITLADRNGVELAYNMAAGTSLPFRGVRVTAISGGTFYGWI